MAAPSRNGRSGVHPLSTQLTNPSLLDLGSILAPTVGDLGDENLHEKKCLQDLP